MKLRRAVRAIGTITSEGMYALKGNLSISGDVDWFTVIIKPVYPEADAEGWIETAKRKPTKADSWAKGECVMVWVGFPSFLKWDGVKSEEITYWMPAPRPPSKAKGRK